MTYKTEVPEWKAKLRRTGRISYLSAFVVGLSWSVAHYGIHAAAFGRGLATGLMLALFVMVVFGAITFFRGRAAK
jgi:uncharacterized membrane protein (UPF0136 family)